MMNTYHELLSLRHAIYSTNERNGFWKDGNNRNYGEALMLVITELSEAVESDRKQRYANERFSGYLGNNRITIDGIAAPELDSLEAFKIFFTTGELNQSWTAIFSSVVKDTR